MNRNYVFLLIFLLSGILGDRGNYTLLATEPGSVRTISLDGIDFVFRWCPPGSFQMGSPANEKDRYEDEIQHRVNLSRGFWILETEVTQEMYRLIMNAEPSNTRGVGLPVDSVNWDEACSFAERLNRRFKISPEERVMLPTEAQWEYACRAGSKEPFAGPLDEMAWFGENRSTGSTHPVGSRKPNAWGIHDMHGNLWEWCFDRYTDYTSEEVCDPVGIPGSEDRDPNSVRIDRGGCWDSVPGYCRSAHRGTYESGRRSPFVGFRIVLWEPIPSLKAK